MPEQGSSSAWLEEEEPPSVSYHVCDSNVSDSHFTSKQEELFRRRFDEGYDIEDAEYTRWLRIAHPELQSNLSNSSLTQTPSLTDFFPGVEPQSALEVENETVLTLTKTSSPLSSSSTPHSDVSLFKYLTSPHLSSPDTSAVLKKSFPCARLLTSADSLEKIEEKERKKQKELEDKERRRKEREDKKKVKEEEMKQKAELRAKKAEDRAQKITMKGRRRKGKGKERETTVEENVMRSHPGTSGHSVAPPTKKRRCQDLPEIDVNVCSVCFGEYGDDVLEGMGVKWITCACGRWLHVDCAKSRIIDVNGCERFCPYCIC